MPSRSWDDKRTARVQPHLSPCPQHIQPETQDARGHSNPPNKLAEGKSACSKAEFLIVLKYLTFANFMKTYEPVHTLLGSPRALEDVLQARLLEIQLLMENLPLSRKEVIYLH